MIRLDRNNPNTYVGVILLVVLAVFVLPDRLPQFISDLSPQLFAGIPCGRLPSAGDLATRQSIIGRRASDPLLLELDASEIDGDGGLLLRLSVTNRSLGALPIVYQEDNISVAAGDDSSDGFGFIIVPAPAVGTKARSDPNPTAYAEADIRLLGPRQKCVHTLTIRAAAAMISGGGSAQAWYRMSVAGAPQPPSDGKGAIYSDQGLDILSGAVVFSEELAIEARA